MALRRIGVWAVVLGVTLASCGGSEESAQRTPIQTEAPTFTPDADASSPARDALERDYEQLRNIQNAIGPVWENLAAGGQVRCGTRVETLSPAAISPDGAPSLEAASAYLRAAAVALDQAVRLWETECGNPRPEPPAEVISRGRLAVREAGTALDAASGELGIE